MADTARTICIYHAHCADGFTAAWAVRLTLGDEVQFVPAGYGDAPPDVTGADVVIVDFSYPRQVLMAMADAARSVLVLDHHKTAAEALHRLPVVIERDWNKHVNHMIWARSYAPEALRLRVEFDMNRSGAQIAWDYFHPDADRPYLIDVVADRDLWRWRLTWSRELNAVIGSHDLDFSTWFDLHDRLEDKIETGLMVSEGAAILRAQDKLVRQIIDTSRRRMRIGGHNVPVAPAPYALASDTAGTMAEGEPFAATYCDTPKGRAFSLRSRGDGIDVSQIAQTYGGGGHRGAAGFLAAAGWEGDA